MSPKRVMATYRSLLLGGTALVLTGPALYGSGYSLSDSVAAYSQLYYRTANQASASGFAYSTQAQKQRDLRAIDANISRMRRDVNVSPAHKEAYKMAVDARRRVANTPVDPSGAGRAGNAAQVMADFQKQMQNLKREMEAAKKRVREQTAADNKRIGAAKQEGLAKLDQAGRDALEQLAALDAADAAASQNAGQSSSLTQALLDQFGGDVQEFLDALASGVFQDPVALGATVPGLLDPQVLEFLQGAGSFTPLDPNDFIPPPGPLEGNGIPTEKWPNESLIRSRIEQGMELAEEDYEAILGKDPRTAPAFTYTGDMDCDDGEVTGIGRELAIAEYDAKKQRIDEMVAAARAGDSSYLELGPHPKDAPVFAYPGDVLSTASGEATGMARADAIAQYEEARQKLLDAQDPAPVPTGAAPPPQVQTAPNIPPPYTDPIPHDGSLLGKRKNEVWQEPRVDYNEVSDYNRQKRDPDALEQVYDAMAKVEKKVQDFTKETLDSIEKKYDEWFTIKYPDIFQMPGAGEK